MGMGRRDRGMWVRLMGVFGALLAFSFATFLLDFEATPLGTIVHYSLIVLLSIGGAIWIARGTQRITRPFLRQRLLEYGIPVCAQCCYNLTGNTSGVCPECGNPIPDDIRRVIAKGQKQLTVGEDSWDSPSL